MRTPKARALGKALREAREVRGLKLREFADQLGRDPSVLSRWETGERMPASDQVAQLLTMLGINGNRYDEIMELTRGADERMWLAVSLPEQRQQLAAVLDLEQTASEITEVSPLLVPGLLQTSSYVRTMMASDRIPPGEAATRVAIRIGRKDVLTRPEPVRLVALIGEGALHQMIGGPDVMVEQLRYLLDMAQRPNVDLRVIPFNSGWHPALEGPFTLIESDQPVPVVHLENRRSGLFLHEEEDVRIYRQAIEMVTRVAMKPEESAQLIRKIGDRMETTG